MNALLDIMVMHREMGLVAPFLYCNKKCSTKGSRCKYNRGIQGTRLPPAGVLNFPKYGFRVLNASDEP